MDSAVYSRSLSVYLSEKDKKDISQYPVAYILPYFINNMDLMCEFTVDKVDRWERALSAHVV